MELLQGLPVVELEQAILVESFHVVYGHIHAVHAAQDGAALLFQVVGEGLDLFRSGAEQFIKLGTESRVIRRNGRQHAGMKERSIERLFDLAHGLNDAGFEQGVQFVKAQHLFFQRIEAAQRLNVFFGKRWQIGIGENFNQRNFKWRERQ